MDVLTRRIPRNLLAVVASQNHEAIKYLENLGEDVAGTIPGEIAALQDDIDALEAIVAALIPGHVIEDEGVPLAQRPALNFVGAGVTVTDSPTETVVTIGAGGGGNAVTVPVDFGASFTDKAQIVVTGLTWVTPTTRIVADVMTPTGTDPDEMYLLDFQPVISDRVAGVGFTLTLYSQPEARGVYDVSCIGA
jgi:hypothetical protein